MKDCWDGLLRRWQIKAFIVLLIGSLLTACVAAVMATAAASVIVYDRRSLSAMESDARIFYRINKTIVSDRQFMHSRIHIVSFNQVVLLIGQTPTASLRVAAEKIAAQTPNVRRVYNEITVNQALSLAQSGRDSLITSQVRTHMLTRKGLESGSIRVVTEDAVVYLMGIVTHEQANIAVDVARRVQGVNKVVKVFQYIV